MPLSLAAEMVPLTVDEDGVVRVGRTRVTLDSVVAAFQDGATAEEILQRYPKLSLADIYAVIAYYLKRTDEVQAYLREREDHAQQVRQQNEVRFDPQGIRHRLLERGKPES